MADELISGQVPVAPNEPGTVGQAFGSTPNEPGAQTSTPTPQQLPEQGTPAKVNWQESPEFKAYQSQQDKRIAQLQQQLAQQEQRQHEAAMAQMTPEQRTQYQLQLTQRQLQEYQRQLQVSEEQKQRDRDIQQLSKLSGAPADVFAAATTYEEATMLALEYARQHSPEALATAAQRREANQVDLGTGSAVSADDRRVAAAKAKLAEGDSIAYFTTLLSD